MAQDAKNGMLDLEKELTCSICTEVLYQPLTLLDCLHTFCGSCLKAWFSLQASQANSRHNPFTCPSCRAPVRETRPNATVTTLLEMYLQANPGRARSEKEKEETKRAYTPGENVLPKVKRRKENDVEAEDRRMVEEARELSLREVGLRGSGSYQRGVRHRVRDSERNAAGGNVAQSGVSTDPASQARQIEHQSSLRSLLGSSDLDSSEMEEEILRQIMDEGILDGIDLNNLDMLQEDELSERIAEAYRRRHARRPESRGNRTAQRRSQSQDHNSAVEQGRQRRSAGSSNPNDSSSTSLHPPISRPHLLEAYPTGQGHRRRTSSEHRRQTSPTPSSHSRASSDTQRQAARSATDLSNQPHTSDIPTRPGEVPPHIRQTTDPDRLQPEARARDRSSLGQPSRSPNGRARITSSATTIAQPSALPTPSTNIDLRRVGDRPRDALGSVQQAPVDDSVAGSDGPSTPLAATTQLPIYTEPSISCEKCGRANLQYDLHWNCNKCRDGKYNICQRCYRYGKGCLHWYGFGGAAMQRYERQAPPNGYSPNRELPHELTGHRYITPTPDSLHPATLHQRSTIQTTSDPANRLQSGLFCSDCSSFSPDCYWKCDVCNEGEWGFCNPCVNQGRCCTHALLPVVLTAYLNHRRRLSTQTAGHPKSTSFAPAHTSSASYSNSNTDPYTTLTISTHCDICTYPIPPSTTRFHCPVCNDGDYDLCTACYLNIMKRGTITADNGPKGWRRCPKGHRMIVVGFEDSPLGQRRAVVQDLVGGHALEEANATVDGTPQWSWGDGEKQQARAVARNPAAQSSLSVDSIPTSGEAGSSAPPLLKRYPPNGGIGLRILALWSYWPQDGVEDELAFPRGAEIRECEDINGDWFWGVYCARKGLIPAGYGRIVGSIGM
ncbi:MAG: hypothetical protein Q9217_002003 [Psora testacea]